MAELKRRFPDAEILTDAGESPAAAAAVAARADVAIVFAFKTEAENHDHADLQLPWGQDALISAVAAANRRTVLVLQISFYDGVAQTPHPELPGFGTANDTSTVITYHEGAEVGYRWLHRTGAKPLFPFGHGLGYTRFEYGGFRVRPTRDGVDVEFTVRNVGARAGADVPQVYLLDAPDGRRMRLLAYERVALKPGQSRRLRLAADPRLLGRFDADAGQWRIAPGSYRLALGASSGDLRSTADVRLPEWRSAR